MLDSRIFGFSFGFQQTGDTNSYTHILSACVCFSIAGQNARRVWKKQTKLVENIPFVACHNCTFLEEKQNKIDQ